MVHAAEGTIQAYLDGEIDSAAERALCEHVAACAVCVAELETLRAANELVQESLELIDAPVPMMRAQAAIARERRGGQRMARIGAWGLAKAAMLLLVLAGAGAAAIPDVRRALETTFSRVVAMFSGGPERTATVPAELETGEPAPDVVPGESFVAPADGRVRIVLETPARGSLEVFVRLTDGEQAHVVTATAAAGSRRSASGELELRDLGAGTVTIALPRGVREATVAVDGRVRVYKEDGLLRGSDAVAGGSEVRFIVGS